MSKRVNKRIIEQQTTKNLELAEQFLNEVLEDEKILRNIPEGAKIIFAPVDDPELARMNFEMAVLEMFKGNPVVMYKMGGLTPEVNAWRATEQRHIMLHEIRFPNAALLASDVCLVYDQARDTLLVDFFGGRRTGRLLEVSPHIMLRVDANNYEIVGYVVTSYLQAEAFRSPILVRALRKATFRAITDDELGDIQVVRSNDTPFNDAEAAAVASQIIQMISPRHRADYSPPTRDSA